MHAAIADKREELAELCRRYDVVRLEIFGSAARATDFDPDKPVMPTSLSNSIPTVVCRLSTSTSVSSTHCAKLWGARLILSKVT